MKLNLHIETNSQETVKTSFDRIATDLINNWNLKINEVCYSFTEIEFYFFMSNVHEDNATHKHNYDEGLWRCHSQGLDITFQGNDKSDGGILIRGLKSENDCINGPKRILELIFKNFGQVTTLNKEFGLIPKINPTTSVIYKAKRHGLSDKQDNPYIKELYRYYTDIENWKVKHISISEKEKIKQNSIVYDYR